MRTFKVKAHGHGEVRAHPAMTAFQIAGYRAPGPGVMVVQEGAGWVRRQDGSREDISATSVVMWDTGDWVEYGSDGMFKTRDYWAATVPEQEWQSRAPEVSGPSS